MKYILKKFLKRGIIYTSLILLPLYLFGEDKKLIILQNKSIVVIEGTSTLHDWTVKSSKIISYILINNIENNTLDFLIKSKVNGKLIFPVDGLKSGKKDMDKVIYETLEKEKYPNIIFNILEYKKIEHINNNEVKVYIRGQLTIKNKSQIIEFPANLTWNKDQNNYQLKTFVNLKMSDFNITPPSAMMGMIKSGDLIKLNFNIFFILE